MKKGVSLLLVIVIVTMISLCGCSSTRENKEQSTNSDYLVIEFVSDSKIAKQVGEDIHYTEYWKVANNTKETINGVSITVCYCDEDRNIVYTDTRISEISLLPGQSIEILSSSNRPYISSYVSNYEYKDGNRWIEVDCVANGNAFNT